MKARRRQID